LGGEELLIGEELVELLLGLGDDLVGGGVGVCGGVPEGGSEGGGDHGLEFMFLLNFVAVISD
jgi:hypothetical protein